MCVHVCSKEQIVINVLFKEKRELNINQRAICVFLCVSKCIVLSKTLKLSVVFYFNLFKGNLRALPLCWVISFVKCIT